MNRWIDPQTGERHWLPEDVQLDTDDDKRDYIIKTVAVGNNDERLDRIEAALSALSDALPGARDSLAEVKATTTLALGTAKVDP